MAIIQYIVNTIASAFWVIVAIGAFIAILFFALGKKLPKKVKVVNRSEIIKQKLIKTLKCNRRQIGILRQKKNILGLIRNIGSYAVGNEEVYFILYSSIPAIWNSNVLIISKKFTNSEIKMWKWHKKLLPRYIMTIREDFFIDEYFNVKLNFADENAIDMLRMNIGKDESEVGSGNQLAQAMRLSIIDFNEVFKAPEPIEEKVKEVEKK